MKRYKLKILLAGHSAGSVIKDDGYSYFIDGTSYDTRGSIYEGEMAMLLDFMRDKELTSLLEPIDKRAPNQIITYTEIKGEKYVRLDDYLELLND